MMAVKLNCFSMTVFYRILTAAVHTDIMLMTKARKASEMTHRNKVQKVHHDMPEKHRANEVFNILFNIYKRYQQKCARATRWAQRPFPPFFPISFYKESKKISFSFYKENKTPIFLIGS